MSMEEGAREANTNDYRFSMKRGSDRTNELLAEIRDILKEISDQQMSYDRGRSYATRAAGACGSRRTVGENPARQPGHQL